MLIKKNLIDIKTSATLAINELSHKLEKKGKVIYKFGLGQSPFPVPKIVAQELIKIVAITIAKILNFIVSFLL